MVFLEQIQALLKAGLGLNEALSILEDRSLAGWSRVASALLQDIRQGESLSKAMSRQGIFPGMLIALIEASEVTSRLSDGLQEFIVHAKRAEEVRAKVVSVALYPAMVLGIGAAVVVFLAFVVMPRFAQVFVGMQGDLPWAAQAMVWWREFLQAHGTAAVGMFVVPALLLVAAWWNGWLKRAARNLAWAARPVADAVEKYEFARWYRATSVLVAGGIAFPEAVVVSSTVLGAEKRDRANAVMRAMRQGAAPSLAYEAAGMSTAVLGRMLRAGEQGGQAAVMLARAADFHEAEVMVWLDRVMKMAEPVVMAVIGIVVGALVVLMYLPVFELAAAVR